MNSLSQHFQSQHWKGFTHAIHPLNNNVFTRGPPLAEISRLTMASAEQGAGTDQTDRGMRKEYFSSSGVTKFLPPVFKLLELAVAIICIGLIDDPANNSRFRVFLATRTASLASFHLRALSGSSPSSICLASIPWKLQSLLNLTAFILYLASAACILNDWSETKTRNYWPPNTQR
ncbi:hypothetical protein pipiens_004120 [Culex pipiens pipiens]|uniref:Uncharacterized protein n=1 Tax=Culex pipiens pipiens TaxID=38569 RepID=A0ABD1CN25_CULPP